MKEEEKREELTDEKAKKILQEELGEFLRLEIRRMLEEEPVKVRWGDIEVENRLWREMEIEKLERWKDRFLPFIHEEMDMEEAALTFEEVLDEWLEAWEGGKVDRESQIPLKLKILEHFFPDSGPKIYEESQLYRVVALMWLCDLAEGRFPELFSTWEERNKEEARECFAKITEVILMRFERLLNCHPKEVKSALRDLRRRIRQAVKLGIIVPSEKLAVIERGLDELLGREGKATGSK